jgi:hypothetical protein
MKTKHFWTSNTKIINDTYINPTFHELLLKSNEELFKWIDDLRARVIQIWDEDGTPPLTGKAESEIIDAFNDMSNFPVSEFTRTDEITGLDNVILSTSYIGSVTNQFFPSMLQVPINYSTNNDGYSIYDLFKDDKFKKRMYLGCSRHFRRDSFYKYSCSITENPKDGGIVKATSGKDWIEKFNKFPKLFENYGFWLSEVEEVDTDDEIGTGYTSTDASKFLYVTALDIKDLGDLVPGSALNNVKELKFDGYKYPIRVYKKETRIFPSGFTAFKIGYIQNVAGFNPLIAKYIYEKYTKHIKDQTVINIYDPSSGWGGRLIGAMSIKPGTKVHYIGTDPNMDNFIPELGVTRYQYMADMFNKKTYRGKGFFSEPNSFEIFQLGSEVIHENEHFQKYKGQLDLVGTSPPYGNRENYSKDETQSLHKFPEYESWKQGFLRPTLTTCYEYLKPDRYFWWNIADTKVPDGYIPLEQDSIDICVELGFQYVGKELMALANMPGKGRINKETGLPTAKNYCMLNGKYRKVEPVFIFYKPL